uniref:Uncharacterized protein n=1 Tax=Kalanchoe fedtschenkoi TaxID=63787 RepID=A0A7N0TED6_KALFE
MLLSPGHSPRHLSSPSPSGDQNRESENSSSTKLGVNAGSKSLKKKVKVLDEDAYVAAVEKIIERDFFPDIPKLRDRLDWLEAVRSGDPVQIRDAQLKIMERRGRIAAGKSSEGSTRGATRTPGSTFVRNFTPLESDKTPGGLNSDLGGVGAGGGLGEGDDVVGDVDEGLSLDEFFRRYTSEDNESFSKILEKVNRKRKERFGHLTEGEKGDMEAIEDAKRDRITDGYGTSDQPPSTLEGWKYTAKNLLMYHPADRGELQLTDAERDVRVKALTKEINRSNTRFHGKMMDSQQKDDDEVVPVLYTQVAGGTPVPMSSREMDKLKKYDLEDLKQTPHPFYAESTKMAENGYSFVKTPSPAPGVDESPFITWGEIEGTPMRLEPEETPIGIGGSGDGPHFKIPSLPSRDEKAHSLSREAARKLRERSKMFQKPPLPSPSRGGSASPSVRTFSPAAQKFMRNAISKSSKTVDESLRASYRGASPVSGTPKGGRSISRLGNTGQSKSPSVRDGSNPPW